MEFSPRDLKNIGAQIKAARKKKNQKQIWLAKLLGTKTSAISNIENGRRPVPRDKVDLLARTLNLHPGDLIPKERVVKDLEGLSIAFRGVGALPQEAIAELETVYQSIKARYAKQKVEIKRSTSEIAADVLEECGITKPPVDLDKICSKYKIAYSFDSNLKFPGVVFKDHKNNAVMVGIDGKMNPGRKRFTLAHECGHVILGHLAMSKSGIECLEIGLAKDDREREADDFASNLLMPEKWVRETMGKKITGIQDVLGISSLFDVSRTAAARKLVDVSSKRCAVIMSEHGEIKWGIASRRLGAWIKRGTKLEKKTQAFKLLSDSMSAKKPEKTKPEYWFEGGFSGNFKEHSASIYKGSTVLTLIWEN